MLLPLHALAEGCNQSIPSFIRTITGLSKARISKGNLDSLRPSDQARVERHQRRYLEERLDGDEEAIERVLCIVSTAPLTRSGAPAAFASWVHMIEISSVGKLHISKAVALVLDDLVESLGKACRNNDLQTFKAHLLNHCELNGNAVRVGDQRATEPMDPQDLARLNAIESWPQAAEIIRGLVDALYVDLISTLDAEWSGQYFGNRQTQPLFPQVMVRPQDGLLDTGKASSRKNAIFRPSRRLLEFMYALVFWLRHKRWPEKAPSPRTLAGILYRPGADELAAPELISNYFDGTTKLTLDLAVAHWRQLLDYFLDEQKETKRPMPPFPMIMLALQWQTLLVRDGGKSFIMFDLKRYQDLWQHRRNQHEEAASRQTSMRPNTGHPSEEPLVWPAWSLIQSSSSP